MPEYKLPEEEKRQAVIVGINYEKKDSTFPKLTGAVNDAKEIYKRLKDPHIGNFEVSNDHYLTEKKRHVRQFAKLLVTYFGRLMVAIKPFSTSQDTGLLMVTATDT